LCGGNSSHGILLNSELERAFCERAGTTRSC
jgi:hypothetical protein